MVKHIPNSSTFEGLVEDDNVIIEYGGGIDSIYRAAIPIDSWNDYITLINMLDLKVRLRKQDAKDKQE